jgi:hypothetical protein
MWAHAPVKPATAIEHVHLSAISFPILSSTCTATIFRQALSKLPNLASIRQGILRLERTGGAG